MKTLLGAVNMMLARGLFLLWMLFVLLKLLGVGIPATFTWGEVFYPLIGWIVLVFLGFILTLDD